MGRRVLRPYEEKPKTHAQNGVWGTRVCGFGYDVVVWEALLRLIQPLRVQHGIWRFANGARLAPREFAIDAR